MTWRTCFLGDPQSPTSPTSGSESPERLPVTPAVFPGDQGPSPQPWVDLVQQCSPGNTPTGAMTPRLAPLDNAHLDACPMVPEWTRLQSVWPVPQPELSVGGQSTLPKLRRIFHTERYRVCEEWKDRILSWSGLEPSVDAFASSDNNLFPRFWTQEDDAFQQDWSQETL